MAKWQWCLVDDNDKLLVGWQKIGDYWYYLKPNGVMASGWIQDPSNSKWYYLDTNGQMKIGWAQDNNLWYYLDGSGAMYSNGTYTIDGKEYAFNSKGAWQNGSSLVSADCINFVKGYEAFYSYKYDDGTGVTTQGYGCIGDEIANWGDTITEQEASDKLNELINDNYAKPLKEYLDGKGVSLTIPQFDALTSCSYNIGVSSLKGSSLMKYIVSGGRDTRTIQTYFCMWSKATINGVSTTLAGLYKRRVAESNIFNYGTYDSAH